MFSARTEWDATPNPLSRMLGERRRKGLPVLDLTVGNPTACGIPYPENAILEAISSKDALHYRPDPRGSLPAREAVLALYRGSLPAADAGRIFLTASTSESYSLLFRLLCDAGDSVLFPSPSYPLFEYLAGLNDVDASSYRLAFRDGWRMDIDSLRAACADIPEGKLKAIILVNPHNPTGMYLDATDFQEASGLAARHGAALIIDEVFYDYPLAGEPPGRLLSDRGPLTFTLNGLSKLAGLPQMKLGWMLLSGPGDLVSAASDRLEILCDTYLSVNTPVQTGLPRLLELAPDIRKGILERTMRNLSTLTDLYPGPGGGEVLAPRGGWYATLRLPRGRTDEECAAALLSETGIFIYPGYYFDFGENDLVVVSLLPGEKDFSEGIGRMGEWLAKSSRR